MGFYFVTIGEGRRFARPLRLKRKEIQKTEPIRCIFDTANDPREISLDEAVTLENMHPADQLEAFKKLAEGRGSGAEEIPARFGMTSHVVLRFGAVSPKLMQVHRDGDLTLEHHRNRFGRKHRKPESIFDFVQAITAFARGRAHQQYAPRTGGQNKHLMEPAI